MREYAGARASVTVDDLRFEQWPCGAWRRDPLPREVFRLAVVPLDVRAKQHGSLVTVPVLK